VTYTLIASFYSFASGIYIGVTESNDSDQLSQDWQVILFIAGVLFVAGILSGTLFFALIARFLDLLNRKKYIAK
jgi:di/tricarboxylate transporter